METVEKIGVNVSLKKYASLLNDAIKGEIRMVFLTFGVSMFEYTDQYQKYSSQKPNQIAVSFRWRIR
jgi:hypothetical protein